MDTLPVELLAKTLSNLDLELLRIYGVVCKKWKKAIYLAQSLYSVHYSLYYQKSQTHRKARGRVIPKGHYLYYVIRLGYLNLLKYLLEFGCKINDSYGQNLAAKHGHLHILKWGYYHDNWGNTWRRYRGIGYKAALSGNRALIRWLQNIDYFWQEDTDICAGAARAGNLELLKWLKENDFPWDEWVVSHAVQNKHFEVTKWAIENGCPVDDSDYQYAHDDRDILKYFHDHKLCSCYQGGFDYHFSCPSKWRKLFKSDVV